MINSNRLDAAFYQQDVLKVAPELLGKRLVVMKARRKESMLITEVEAYKGEEDRACHASKGKTNRNHVMYESGGLVYVYLVYGMYWMLNIVTGSYNIPQAVLIRGIEGYDGPGKLTRYLNIDKSFYGENLISSERMWIENTNHKVKYKSSPRIGIDYAGEYWKNKLWRFIMNNE